MKTAPEEAFDFIKRIANSNGLLNEYYLREEAKELLEKHTEQFKQPE